jgi:hypothetical protein
MPPEAAVPAEGIDGQSCYPLKRLCGLRASGWLVTSRCRQRLGCVQGSCSAATCNSIILHTVCKGTSVLCFFCLGLCKTRSRSGSATAWHQVTSYKFYASEAFPSVRKLEKDGDRSERA